MRAAIPLVAAAIALGAIAGAARAQTFPPAPKPDGASLFVNHCATCHSLVAGDLPRQGPNLAHVYGRPAGKLAGYAYSPELARADFVWDAAHLDR